MMIKIIANFLEFVKRNKEKIYISIIVFLLSLFSFALGYLISEYSKRTPLIIK